VRIAERRRRAALAGTFFLSLGAGVVFHVLLSAVAGDGEFAWDHGPLARTCYALAREAAAVSSGWASLLAAETILLLAGAAVVSFLAGVVISSLARGEAKSAVGYGFALPLVLLPIAGMLVGGEPLAETERRMGHHTSYYATFFLALTATVCFLAALLGSRIPEPARAAPDPRGDSPPRGSRR